MAELVLFRLEAPIAAFGDLAVGERRGSHRRPAHSAIAGLLAAALGLGRDDPGLEALADGILLAVRTDSIGSPLADFHTAQTPPQKRGRTYATRRQELAIKNDLGTIISRRDYWSDTAFTILLWPTDKLVYMPQDIANALNQPVFIPFVGRRACPLGAPMAAKVIEADSIVEAFARYDSKLNAQREKGKLTVLTPGKEIAFDATFTSEQIIGLTTSRTETRRDSLVNRQRWQFALREEQLATLLHAEKGDDV